MNDALGTEPKSFLADGDVAGKSAVKVLAGGFRDAIVHSHAQSLADIDVFSGDAKRHD
jgi:hypothetical protein